MPEFDSDESDIEYLRSKPAETSHEDSSIRGFTRSISHVAVSPAMTPVVPILRTSKRKLESYTRSSKQPSAKRSINKRDNGKLVRLLGAPFRSTLESVDKETGLRHPATDLYGSVQVGEDVFQVSNAVSFIRAVIDP